MGTIRVLFCLLCGFVIGCGRGDSGGDVTSSRTEGRDLLFKHSSRDSSSLRSPRKDARRLDVVRIARAEVGVREATGRNDGERIEAYLAYTGIKTPAPWCSAFISFVFGKAGYKEPRTAWSPSMFPKYRLTKAPKPADVIGIYFSGLQRIGHVGLIEKIKGEIIYSIEGNTNNNGSREGNMVCRRLRHERTINKVADWVR